MSSEKRYYTVEEAAEYLEVSRIKIYRLIKESELHPTQNKLDKRQRLISKEELDRLKNPSGT